jgi:hypothetical protein
MASGGHGLPIVSPGLAMPDPSMPCGRATPGTALWPLQGGQPAAVFYPFGHPTPYAYGFSDQVSNKIQFKRYENFPRVDIFFDM